MTDMHDWWCDGDGKSNWEGKEHASEDEDLCKKWDTHLKHEEPEKRTKPETPPAGKRPTRVLICPDTLLARQYHRGATIVRSPRAAGGPRVWRRCIIAPVAAARRADPNTCPGRDPHATAGPALAHFSPAAPADLTRPPSACRAQAAALPATLLMLRALLLLACTAKVSAFATLPAGEQAGAGDPACVDLEPEAIQAEYAEALVEALEAGELPEGTTMASCADVAASGGCAEEEVAPSCCATCALPQRMTYGFWGKVKSWWRRAKPEHPLTAAAKALEGG
jgi:hypothetical protein